MCHANKYVRETVGMASCTDKKILMFYHWQSESETDNGTVQNNYFKQNCDTKLLKRHFYAKFS